MIVRAIKHIGSPLADWMTLPRQTGPPSKPTAEGPLSRGRIVILGEPHDG